MSFGFINSVGSVCANGSLGVMPDILEENKVGMETCKQWEV